MTTITDEDTRQVMSELQARMEQIKHSLENLSKVVELTPESKQQLLALQREGIRLGKIYLWLVRG